LARPIQGRAHRKRKQEHRPVKHDTPSTDRILRNNQPEYLGVDLGVVAKFACGCFFKYYYELEKPGENWVDRAREYCAEHDSRFPNPLPPFDTQAEAVAKKKADEIRNAVQQGAGSKNIESGGGWRG
jgi:hypothetical protein